MKKFEKLLKQRFVKGFKKLFKHDKQASKKNYEKFYKLLSKQEIRVLQAFKEKQNKASKYKSKQAKKSFENF